VVELTVALVVGLVVLIIVACLYLPPPSGASKLTRAKAIQVLSNMKTLHLAGQQMTLDNAAHGNPVRWTCSGTTPLSLDQWHQALVPSYLQEKDFQKLLSLHARGEMIIAMNVFAVCDSDAPDTVLFATKNWHGLATNLSGEPFENKCFVIFHKAGDGAILLPNQATNINIIGSGGMHNFLPLK